MHARKNLLGFLLPILLYEPARGFGHEIHRDMQHNRGDHLESDGHTPGRLPVDFAGAILNPECDKNTEVDETLLY
jgi:hypothetical protein